MALGCNGRSLPCSTPWATSMTAKDLPHFHQLNRDITSSFATNQAYTYHSTKIYKYISY